MLNSFLVFLIIIFTVLTIVVIYRHKTVKNNPESSDKITQIHNVMENLLGRYWPYVASLILILVIVIFVLIYNTTIEMDSNSVDKLTTSINILTIVIIIITSILFTKMIYFNNTSKLNA